MAYPSSSGGLQAFNVPQQQNFLSRLFKGKNPTYLQAPTVTQGQSQGLDQLLQMALSGLQNPQAGFQPIADQARQQFAQQTIPSIAERFSSLGSGGAQRSSAFGQTLGAAGAGLESNLAAQGAQYGLQNQQNLARLAQLGLSPQFENIFNPGETGLLQNYFSSLFGGQQGQGGSNPLSLLSTML